MRLGVGEGLDIWDLRGRVRRESRLERESHAKARRGGGVWGDPYGVLCYCAGDRGCRERLAGPPASHRPSLRDGA